MCFKIVDAGSVPVKKTCSKSGKTRRERKIIATVKHESNECRLLSLNEIYFIFSRWSFCVRSNLQFGRCEHCLFSQFERSLSADDDSIVISCASDILTDNILIIFALLLLRTISRQLKSNRKTNSNFCCFASPQMFCHECCLKLSSFSRN